MNKKRRAAIAEVVGRLVEAQRELQEILDEEDTYRDNIPDGLQGSTRYDESEAASDTLESVVDMLDGVVMDLTGIADA